MLRADARTRTAHGMCHGRDCLFLSDNAPVQALLQTGQAGKFLFADLGGGHTRPKLDDRSEMFACQLRRRDFAQFYQLVLCLELQALQLRHVLINFVVLLLL